MQLSSNTGTVLGMILTYMDGTKYYSNETGIYTEQRFDETVNWQKNKGLSASAYTATFPAIRQQKEGISELLFRAQERVLSVLPEQNSPFSIGPTTERPRKIPASDKSEPPHFDITERE